MQRGILLLASLFTAANGFGAHSVEWTEVPTKPSPTESPTYVPQQMPPPNPLLCRIGVAHNISHVQPDSISDGQPRKNSYLQPVFFSLLFSFLLSV